MSWNSACVSVVLLSGNSNYIQMFFCPFHLQTLTRENKSILTLPFAVDGVLFTEKMLNSRFSCGVWFQIPKFIIKKWNGPLHIPKVAFPTNDKSELKPFDFSCDIYMKDILIRKFNNQRLLLLTKKRKGWIHLSSWICQENKICEMSVKCFQDTEHQGAKDSNFWEMGNKWGVLYDCPSLLREFPGHFSGRGNPMNSGGYPE